MGKPSSGPAGLRLGVLLHTVIGVSYSIYGLYLQLGAIRAVCVYCLISAIMTFLLFIVALRHFRVRRIPATIG
jgi:uncharacterized membrane protein